MKGLDRTKLIALQVVGDASLGVVTLQNITLTNGTTSGTCSNAAFLTNPTSQDLNPLYQARKSFNPVSPDACNTAFATHSKCAKQTHASESIASSFPCQSVPPLGSPKGAQR